MTHDPAARPGAGRPARAAWLAVAVVLLATALVRGRLLDVPLERDEGEYAYAGQLLLQGVPPYQAAYNMKFPGTYAAYAVLMAAFGQTTAGVHLGLLVVNAATVVLVFLLARRLFGPAAGVAAAAAYALLAVGPGVFGFAAHATQFVTLFAVAGVLALLAAGDRGRASLYLLAGLLLGTAVLMKQHGATFAAFGLAYALWREWPPATPGGAGRVAALAAGVVVPFGATCVALAAAGVFEPFWFWTFTYAREYAAQVPLEIGWELLRENGVKLLAQTWSLWALAPVGLGLAWRWCPRADAVFVIGFLLAALLATCPGFYFREHYFVVVLPAVAALAGAVVGLGGREFGRSGAGWAGLAFAAAFAWSVRAQAWYLFTATPAEICLDCFGEATPFAVSAEVAARVRADTTPDDRVAVLGSEPQIYFLSGRRSATGYIYTYPMMEAQPFAEEMQRRMVAEVEAARPKYVVVALVRSSWLVRPDSPTVLTKWADAYCRDHYTLAGVVETDRGTPHFHWGEEMAGYRPSRPTIFAVYRRRD